MKRGFPQKIEPLLPSCLSRDALNALTALSETNVGSSQSAGSVVSAVQQIKAEAVASVVRQDDGVDLFEGVIKPVLANSAYQRRVRTSAAVMGLALSMGASDIFSALQTRQAVAAEAMGTADEAQRSAELALELQALAESAQQELEAGLYTESATQVVARAEQSAASAELKSDFPEVDAKNSFHVIQSGETLYGIARAYGISVDQLATVNDISKSTSVIAGNTLKVPSGAVAPVEVAQVVSGSSVALSTAAPQSASADVALAELRQRREALRQSLRSSDSTSVSEQSSASTVALSELTPYRVKAGDTVDSIARQFSVKRSELLAVNRLENPNVLKVDQNIAIPQAAAEPVKLSDASEVSQEIASIADAVVSATAVAEPGEVKLPDVVAARSNSVAPPSRPIETFKPATAESSQLTHRVQSGETLAVIARSYGVSLSSLSAANRISDPDLIFVGQQVKLPAGATAVQAVAARTQPAPALQAESEKVLTPVASVDYVDNLMSEIRDLRQKYQSGSSAVASEPASVEAAPEVSAPEEVAVAPKPAELKPIKLAPVVEAAKKPDSLVASRLAASRSTLPAKVSVSVKPESSSSKSIKVTLPLPQKVASEEPQLVASASLGSQSYEPLAQSILRQSVHPELPPLMSDPFLPDQASEGFIWPAKGVLTSGYGWRWGRMHKGLDIAGPIGTPINAAADGTVTYAGWASGYGNLVEITHPDGAITLYGHNDRNVVREGDRVRQGQHIADMGNTGRSTGPHLHFEIRPSGQGAVNPAALLPQRR